MNKTFISIICIFIIIFAFQIAKSQPVIALKINPNDFVLLNNKQVFLGIADTPEKQRQGLMYIEKLSEDQGMVFLFNRSSIKAFWMKNMKISLDILFISKNKIVDIYKEVPACKEEPCPTYDSTDKVDTVLELKSGFCDKYGIKTGDNIKFSSDIITREVNQPLYSE